MRKQYHLRDSSRGLLAWDVDRLVELSRDLPKVLVPLAEIAELDENYWFQVGENPPTCRAIADHMQLVEEANLSYPIILDSGGRVFDGMHRVVKALLAGRDAIDAVRFTSDPEPDHVGRGPDELPY
jgi:hypothetical protein